MDYTLHLTDKCNLDCKYCYQGKKGNKKINFSNIKDVLDSEVKNGTEKVYISFFGGEPLLEKNLIYDTVKYAKKLEKQNKTRFIYAITTNGILLDKKFIRFAAKNDFIVELSLDGKSETHDKNRITYDGKGTFNIIIDNFCELIKRVKKVFVMPVITKNNYKEMVENVRYFFDIGCRYINCALDYSADWNDTDISFLKNEYEKLAELYYEKTKEGIEFYLLPFDVKMNTYIKNADCEEKCILAKKHINLGSDGKLYPCMQFVGKEEYIIGDSKNGIDKVKLAELRNYRPKDENNTCSSCDIRKRCRHACSCLNIITTGDMRTTSPLVCETERMLIEISDKLAERLYKEKNNTFYKKKYNGY